MRVARTKQAGWLQVEDQGQRLVDDLLLGDRQPTGALLKPLDVDRA